MQPQNYTLTSVKDTGWDPDQYGNKVYNVTLDGYHDAVLFRTPKQPEVGSQVYGHTEPAKSGKSTWLKRDKREDGQPTPPAPPAQPNNIATAPPAVQQAVLGKHSDKKQGDTKNAEIIWSICIKEAATFVNTHREDMETETYASAVSELANALYRKVLEPKANQSNTEQSNNAPSNDYAVTAEEFDATPVVLPDDIPF